MDMHPAHNRSVRLCPPFAQSRLGLSLLGFCAGLALSVSAATITIEVDKPGHAISPLLYGIFFEDINCSADGGLYAELVRNRNFEDSDQPLHWSTLSSDPASVQMCVDSSRPVSPKNQHALRVSLADVHGQRAGVVNEGFWGISVKRGGAYELSFFARGGEGFSGPLVASLESTGQVIYASSRNISLTPEWKKYQVRLTSKQTDAQARLVISSTESGTFWLDMVSLFPRQTWKQQANGLRPDLAGMLTGLRPSFVRFPGGCWVEGDTMSLAYRWKQTIGEPSERRTQHNIWQYEATHGLGFHEDLQLCEDLLAEPLFVINCGMSHKENVPLGDMPAFVQDALDAIEYANGPVESPWGALRAKHGHRAPFHLRYMEIGNENGSPAYHERYALFYDAIKARYPEIHLVADDWSLKNRPIEIVDEHYYASPEFFIQNADKYDTYDRAGRKVYVGEYAVTEHCGQGNLRAAVGEAAFMTGLERNSDVVLMASYAPLFANVNYKKWNPDLINFDSSRVYGVPSYYVQKMFSENRGDVVLPLTIDAPELPVASKSGAIGVGTWRTEAEFKDIKVTRGAQVLFASDFSEGGKGWRRHGGDWSIEQGALHQRSLEPNIRAFAGDKSWNNYTYTLKARKLAGDEGFLIPFLVQDEEAKAWWNIGGWGNTKHAIEMDGSVMNEVAGNIETGRWYDIRIEVMDNGVRCYLDGSLVHDLKYPKTKPLVAVASRTKKEVILKVVNVSRDPQETQIELKGARLGSKASLTMLTSDQPKDENTLDQPTKVAPVTQLVECGRQGMRRMFPANSVSVLRFKYR